MSGNLPLPPYRAATPTGDLIRLAANRLGYTQASDYVARLKAGQKPVLRTRGARYFLRCAVSRIGMDEVERLLADIRDRLDSGVRAYYGRRGVPKKPHATRDAARDLPEFQPRVTGATMRLLCAGLSPLDQLCVCDEIKRTVGRLSQFAASLSPRQQYIMRRRIWAETSYRKIAKPLGVSGTLVAEEWGRIREGLSTGLRR